MALRKYFLMLSIKKTAKAKRAPLPRKSDYSRSFEKDWEKLSHSGSRTCNGSKLA